MKNLPDKLSDEQVKDLAIAGRVKFEIFLNHPQFFAVIDGDLYRYKEGESYHLLKRGYEEYKSKINERL